MTTLQKGDVVEIRIGGGAGWGNPAERDKAAVERDLIEEKISPEYAKRFHKC
jgi:N-methylhydantoinase B